LNLDGKAQNRFLKYIGERVLDATSGLGRITELFRQTIYWIGRRPLRSQDVVSQMMEIGVRSFPVIGLTALFTGMVLALQTGYAFSNFFGEPVYVGMAVGFSMVKELGPVTGSMVLAGRVGAAIAAELGTMKVTEQIDALYTLGTNPVKYLVVPRFLACLIVVPILTLLADIIGVLGGLLVSVYSFNIPATVYRNEILDFMRIDDVYQGLIKALFFALIIIMVCCYKGFTCEGGAQGVGRATTSAVVSSMVLILISDYFLTAFLVSIGIGATHW